MPNGADILCAALEECGVGCVFGLPGTQNVPLYEALRRTGIRSVLATHELAASFMANGYHRAGGALPALFTIPGPGFTYALTGLSEASQDSAALLHVVGKADMSRPFAFQALDQAGVARPMVKAVVTIESSDEVAARVREAASIALRGEPGPVILQWVPDALAARASLGSGRGEVSSESGCAAAVEAAEFLASARRPLLFVGQGAAAAAGMVVQLAETLSAAVAATTSGRGIVPEDHPLALGFDSARCDTRALNELVELSDVVLVLGCKLTAAGTADFELKLPRDRLIRVDASAEVLAAGYPARIAVEGAVEQVVPGLLEAARKRRPLEGSGWPSLELESWRERLRGGNGSIGGPEPVVQGVAPETASAFFGALRAALPRDGILVLDSGLHQELARRHFPVLAPRGLILPSDFQSMGYALPAAIGARLAAPSRPVVALLGDGGFLISGMEVLTAIREQVSLTVVVFNDGHLNRIRLQQQASYGRSVNVDILNPDYQAIAAALGARYAAVEGDAVGVLGDAIRREGVTLVEVILGDSLMIREARVKGLVRGVASRSGGVGLFRRVRGAWTRWWSVRSSSP